MFARRLQLLFNKRIQGTCWGFCSINHFHKVNLTFLHHRTPKYNNVYSKSRALPIYTVRSNSNLSSIKEHDIDDNDDDYSINVDGLKVKSRITENGFSYSILKSEKYNKTIVKLIIPEKNIPDSEIEEILAKDYDDFSSTELLEDFKTLSLHARLNSIPPSELHSKLYDLISKYVPSFSDDQLLELMKHLELWFPLNLNIKPESFDTLINAIDNTLLLRMNDFTVDEMLKYCDLMYHLRRTRGSKFVDRVMLKVGTKPKKLSVENYVHFMYLFVIARQPAINMYELEYALESIIDKYEGNELGIIALAFFKTKTPIRNPILLEKIIERCIKDMDQMGDIAISATMKIIRYSLGLNSLISFNKLLKAFKSRINNASSPCLVHAGQAAATILLNEREIIDAIVERFKDHIPIARVKDLERMLFILTIYDYPKDTPHYELIINELRNPARSEELFKFHRSLISSLMYLTHVGIYPLDIIHSVMDPNYLREMYKNNSFKIGHPYLLIDTGLQIEAPEYTGPTLPPNIRNFLVKKFSASILKTESAEIRVQSHQKFMFEVITTGKELLGSDKLLIDQLLPQYQRADVILCLDNENKSVSPQQFMTELPIGSIKYAPKVPEGYKWICLVLASHNHVFRGTTITCGTLNSKLRQLEKIGYSPIVLIYHIWQQLKTAKGKKEYLHDVMCKHNINQKQFNIKS